MKSATELLEAYLNNVRTPRVSASQFAEDGVLELPWVNAHAQGPAAVERLITGLLAKIPDFRFKNLTYYIQTPDKVAAEYQVEALRFWRRNEAAGQHLGYASVAEPTYPHSSITPRRGVTLAPSGARP